MTNTFTILAVCTGNICRSPAMERLLAEAFSAEPQVRVISAGTHAHDGEDMQSPMKRRVADYGAEVENFTAEQLTAQMIAEADLILAATRVHVADMVAEAPEAAQRIFTLPEFGRLLRSLEPAAVREAAGAEASCAEKLSALLPLVDRAREQATADSEDEIVDPFMLPESVYDESFRQIREPVEELSRVLELKS